MLSNRPTKILLAVLEAHSLGDQGSEADSTRSAGCYKDCIFRNIISVPMKKKNEKKEIRLALCFSHKQILNFIMHRDLIHLYGH